MKTVITLDNLNAAQRSELAGKLKQIANDHEKACREAQAAATTKYLNDVAWKIEQNAKANERAALLSKHAEFIAQFENKNVAMKFVEYNQDLDEVAFWQIKGEDPNCDWGGSHHEPELAVVEGTYRNACLHAVTLPRFFQWGAGGRVVRLVGGGVKRV